MKRHMFVRRQIQESRSGGVRRERLFRAPSRMFWQRLSKIAIVIVLLFIAVSMIAYAIPSVDIVVIPETRIVNGAVPIVFDSTLGASNPSPSAIPATHFKKSFSEQQTVPTSGTIDIGTKARGLVVFTNRTGIDFPLLSDQRIRGGDTNYYTVVSDVVIPRATVSPEGDVVPGTLGTEVEAESGGEQTGLPEGRVLSIMTVPPEKQDKIFGYVSKAIAGGTSKVVQSVAPEDVQQAIDALTSEFKQRTRQEFAGVYGGEYVFDDSLMFMSSLSSSTIPAILEPASEVTVKLSADVVGIAVKRSQLEEAVISHVKATTAVGSGERLSPKLGYHIEQPMPSDPDAYAVKAVLSYSSSIVPELPIDEMKQGVLGKPERAARQWLLSQRGVKDVRITSHWNVFSSIPTSPKRVHVSLGS